MIRELDNPVKKIHVTYEDGTTKTLQKGFFGDMKNDRLHLEFSNMSGEDVLAFLYGMLEFAARVVNSYEGVDNVAQTAQDESRR